MKNTIKLAKSTVTIDQFLEYVRALRDVRSAMGEDGQLGRLAPFQREAAHELAGLDVIGILLDLVGEYRAQAGAARFIIGDAAARNMGALKRGDVPEGQAFTAYHKPSCEVWYLLGVSWANRTACCAGWPASVAPLEDLIYLNPCGKLNQKELEHRLKTYGGGWI